MQTAERTMPVEQQATISVSDNVIHCRGAWTLPNVTELERRSGTLRWPDVSEVACDAGEVTAMDTGGALVLYRSIERLRRAGQNVSLHGLKPEFAELVRLIETSTSRTHVVALRSARWGVRVTQAIRRKQDAVIHGLAFLGETVVILGRSVLRPQSIRWRALLRVIELDGVRALPITGLLTFLVGIVIAYQGAEQLRKFGTNIFIVDLVGISLVREISPLIVAILIAGRSGS
ncbi:MAG: STAS domain-containing protein, partial [Nitrospira sp.]|nr:STAS domain-containing protein [Nitrospira sp.]